MIKSVDHPREKERLKELKSYSIMDSFSENDYDYLTTIAAEICKTPVALINLIDDKRVWVKSRYGLDITETPKEYSFCAHTINESNNLLIVPDTRMDERFHDSPFVTSKHPVIFYAGVSLVCENGLPIGTLCVIDYKPNILSEKQLQSLTALANQVMNVMNLRKKKIILKDTILKLEEKNQELEHFTAIAAHDLKSPLIGISSIIKLFLNNYDSKNDTEIQGMLKLVEKSTNKLRRMIDGLLEYNHNENDTNENKTNINTHILIDDITNVFGFENDLRMNLKTTLNEICVNRASIDQILINLISNSIKYNDKEYVEIDLGISETEDYYDFYVSDNGPGIAPIHHEKIFKMFEVLTAKDKFGQTGNGIGLATVKKIVEKRGGTISVESEVGTGAKFIFSFEK